MIYLDHSATTPLSPEARNAMCEAMERFGNPSSVHPMGHDAAAALAANRDTVRAALGLPPQKPAGGDRLYFTASGTEANNLALRGVAYAKARYRGMEIVTTDSEHPSVAATLAALAADGFVIKTLPTRGGTIRMEDVATTLSPRTFLFSVMSVNNETGARYPVSALFAAAKRLCPGVICHTDAVQAFGQIPLSVKQLGADLVSISAHKIGGPKGVGALYVSEAVLRARALSAVIFGGGQEDNFRSGTENTIGIAGFAAAATTVRARVSAEENLAALRDKIASRLPTEITINTPPVRAPHILSITLPHIKSETMLHYLAAHDICVSAGSACAAHGKGASPALLAFGLTPQAADCTIRISLSHTTTEEEADVLISALTVGVSTLVRS